MAIKEYPFYLKSTIILFGLILVMFVFGVLADILIPLAFAAFLAILLNPLVNRFERFRIPKIFAILLAISIFAIGVAGVFYFLSTQMIQFGDSLPMFKQKFAVMSTDLKNWVASTFGLAISKQDQMIKDALSN